MNYHFYESKIIYILITALVFIQFGSYYALRVNNQNMVQSTIRSELMTSTQVFNRLLELRNRQLKQATQILVGDYGFRESVATQDRSTIESMLINHGKRVDASLLVLTDLDQDVIATVPSNIETQSLKASKAFVVNPASSEEKLNIATISFFKSNGAANGRNGPTSLFQIISTQVSAPLPLAKLAIGYPINDSFAKDLSNVTDTEFFFFSHQGEEWKLHASSMPANIAAQFKPSTLDAHQATYREVTIEEQTYMSVPIALNASTDATVIAIAAKSINKVILPFKKIERMFIYLLLVTLALSIIAIYYVTRQMIRPLNDLAHLDNLTGLGNRRLYNSMIDRAFNALDTSNKPFALMVMDLNKFKQINDTKGHDVGDIVLQLSAQRLKEVMRNSDEIARLGGDEFAIVVQESSRKSLQIIAEKISLAIAQPIPYNGEFMAIGVSIGIAIAPLDASNKIDLIRSADEAMYTAKTTQVSHYFYGDLHN